MYRNGHDAIDLSDHQPERINARWSYLQHGWRAVSYTHLVLVGRRQERITAVAGELRAARPDRRPLAIPTDVTDPTDLEGLIGRTLDEHGRIDVLINNAGQGSYCLLYTSRCV